MIGFQFSKFFFYLAFLLFKYLTLPQMLLLNFPFPFPFFFLLVSKCFHFTLYPFLFLMLSLDSFLLHLIHSSSFLFFYKDSSFGFLFFSASSQLCFLYFLLFKSFCFKFFSFDLDYVDVGYSRDFLGFEKLICV